MAHYDKRRRLVEEWKIEDEGRAHMRNFLDCMRSRARPNSPVELAHQVLVGAHLANEAFRLGRRVSWDPQKMKRV
jgi:hypothetical protein